MKIEPKIHYTERVKNELLSGNVLYIGCLSYEERSIRFVEEVKRDSLDGMKLYKYFMSIEDDECTYKPWYDSCMEKMSINEKYVNTECDDVKIGRFKMSKRVEDIIRLKHELNNYIKSIRRKNLRCIVDISAMPSYFMASIIKNLIYNEVVNDLIVIYIRPMGYPEGMLKRTSPDITKPEMLPDYVKIDLKRFKWIISLGFDYDSVRNAENIGKRISNIESIYPIIPFPAYHPKYVQRVMTENKDLIRGSAHYRFMPADNPFRVYNELSDIIGDEGVYVLSSFGPKPICLGFVLKAITDNLPILHVQSTNYNPNFSYGSSDINIYMIKYSGLLWMDKIKK